MLYSAIEFVNHKGEPLRVWLGAVVTGKNGEKGPVIEIGSQLVTDRGPINVPVVWIGYDNGALALHPQEISEVEAPEKIEAVSFGFEFTQFTKDGLELGVESGKFSNGRELVFDKHGIYDRADHDPQTDTSTDPNGHYFVEWHDVFSVLDNFRRERGN